MSNFELLAVHRILCGRAQSVHSTHEMRRLSQDLQAIFRG